ncbi:hypothetical protein BDB00DRAFT_856948, partial [Zychaea mexicana]|uniref:uncharacterized protein n=1 Tax=Zychaea mexicana TaxID=64656 RepID=UPI0022FEF599
AMLLPRRSTLASVAAFYHSATCWISQKIRLAIRRRWTRCLKAKALSNARILRLKWKNLAGHMLVLSKLIHLRTHTHTHTVTPPSFLVEHNTH